MTINSAHAIVDPSTTSSAAGSELASRLLSQSCQFYRDLDSFSGEIETDVAIKQAGPWQHNKNSLKFKFKRPKYLSVFSKDKTDRGSAGNAVLNDNIGYFRKQNWHMFVESSDGWVNNFNNQDFSFVTKGAVTNSLLKALLGENPYSAITSGVTSFKYDGKETVEGELCHSLLLSKKAGDMQIWVSTGKQPWIKRYKPFPDQDTGVIKASTTILYSNLQANPRLSIHPFNAGADSQKVTHFVVPPGHDSEHPLVGFAAPNFTVRTANGKTFTLSKHRDKVTVMEFWATWCGPCCRALPVLSEVTAEYASQGVEFIAINQMEHPLKVKNFLREHSLHITAGLDPDGKVSRLYHVSGIPQTVIVGKDGLVHFVHIGNSSELQEQIKSELNSIVH